MSLAVVCGFARKSYKLAGVSLERYSIVYSAQAEDEEGKGLALDIRKRIQDLTGKEIPVSPDTKTTKGAKISLVHSPGMKTFDYAVKSTKGNVVIDGGGCWAMRKAADIVVDQMVKKGVPSGYSVKGSVEGEYLFPRREDVNLRILDDNVWYFKDTIPDVWKKAGLDCRDKVRAPQYVQLVRAYMPDIVAFQEYNDHMHSIFYDRLQRYDYMIAYECKEEPWNYTPIFYNKQNIELIESRFNRYIPSPWITKSKSYTAAVFKHKSSGKIFAILNTHLWWKRDTVQAGSDYARASQIRLVMAEAEIIKQKYDCPIFVTGDMNCEEGSLPMQQFLQGGYVPCYKVATVYANKDNGHHVCSPNEVGIRESRRKSPEREKGAIDHCLIYNAKDTEIKVFDCIQAYFTVRLTDHYPNLVDARL